MKTFLAFAFFTLTAITFAQTDIIEMRSLGRSLAKYERMSSITADHDPSNFGMMPLPEVRTALLDSVKMLSDSTAVVYTSDFCRRGPDPNVGEWVYVDSLGRQLNEPQLRRTKPDFGKLWRAGADTVLNHPLFTRRHSLDSIKGVLDRDYYFNYPSDSTKFIGFDNGQQGFQNSDAVQPVQHSREQKKNGFGWELLFIIVTPIAFLLGMNRLNPITLSEK